MPRLTTILGLAFIVFCLYAAEDRLCPATLKMINDALKAAGAV